MREDDIIHSYLAPLARDPGAFGLADDCAEFIPAPGQSVVLKTDPVRAGVHFFADDPPADIAWKALAVNISDLAAKSARPHAYLMALSFPEAPTEAWLSEFAAGLAEAQEHFGLLLLGGDTDRAPGPMSVSVTVLGEVPQGRMIRRDGGRPGDVLFVSGILGEAAAGLALRAGERTIPASASAEVRRSAEAARQRYARPQPRLGLKAALRRYADAAMDISDGLAKDAGRMAVASGCAIHIEAAAVPRAPILRALGLSEREQLERTVAHGDDYEILTSVDPGDADAFEALAAAGGVPVTRIGVLADGEGAVIAASDGTPVDFKSTGWEHF